MSEAVLVLAARVDELGKAVTGLSAREDAALQADRQHIQDLQTALDAANSLNVEDSSAVAKVTEKIGSVIGSINSRLAESTGGGTTATDTTASGGGESQTDNSQTADDTQTDTTTAGANDTASGNATSDDANNSSDVAPVASVPVENVTV